MNRSMLFLGPVVLANHSLLVGRIWKTLLDRQVDILYVDDVTDESYVAVLVLDISDSPE